ncbi:Ssl1-like-domain-containing protein [Dipodascopsis uninucleata]
MSDSDGSYVNAASSGSEELRSTTGGGYIWEDSIQRSWDVVQEDAGGSLAGVVAELVQAGKRRRLLQDTTPLQRGIIRHLILAIDCSNAMTERDLRPTRYQLSLNYAIQFVVEYFEQNPISQLGIIGMRDGLSYLVSQLGGNPSEHIVALQALKKNDPSGDPSLQNALEMSRGALYHVPSHGTKEVVIIFGSLLSCDPGDIHKTIDTLAQEKIHVRIVGLAAEVEICREICKRTNNGDVSTYGVILNEQHFKQLLSASCVPPASTKKTRTNHSTSELMRMGFPSRIVESSPSFCACHSRLVKGGYICPRCHVKVCALPTECPSCGLTLILSTHLARSYHHLMPLVNWKELDFESARKYSQIMTCFSCLQPFPPSSNHLLSGGSGRFQCHKCHNLFCIDCDLFAHEILHNCPGCESSKPEKRNRTLNVSAGPGIGE